MLLVWFLRLSNVFRYILPAYDAASDLTFDLSGKQRTLVRGKPVKILLPSLRFQQGTTNQRRPREAMGEGVGGAWFVTTRAMRVASKE